MDHTVSVKCPAMEPRDNLLSLNSKRHASFPFQIKLHFLLYSLFNSCVDGRRSNIVIHCKKRILIYIVNM